jgi:ParB family chromosome partitioning protein
MSPTLTALYPSPSTGEGGVGVISTLFSLIRKEELIMATYAPNQLHQVPLAELQPDPAQPRKYMDPVALEELTASIIQNGIIVPIVCRQDRQTGLIYVVAGDRRCAAARKAGLATVPAVFIEGENYAEIALVENLLRQDLNPVEEAEALKKLMDDHSYQQDELAKIIGKSPATISLSLSINKLPKEIRDVCRQDPTVSRNVLIEIARKKQERAMLTQFAKYRDQQEKAAAKETADATNQAARKRTKAEAIVNGIGIWSNKLGDLEFPDFSADDRAMMIEAMNSMKDTLEAAITRAVKNKKKPI